AIGDEPEQYLLLAGQKHSGAIYWLGYCSNSADLVRYYRAADLFVHPGVQETFGLVTLESQACGTPVVGIRGSYMDRIIFHEQEWWARKNTAEALTDAIQALSLKKLQMLGSGAAGRAGADYAWPRVVAQLFCIYREVCAKYR